MFVGGQYQPYRLGLNTNIGGRALRLHPRYVQGMKFYFPMRDATGGGAVNNWYHDYGPKNRYTIGSFLTGIDSSQNDAYGMNATLIGDPYQTDRFPIVNSQNDYTTGAFSAMGWVRPWKMASGSSTAGMPVQVVCKRASGANVNCQLHIWSDNKAYFQFTVGGVYKQIASTILYPSSVYIWHHLAGIYDGSNMYLYVDGTLVASGAASGTPDQGGTSSTNTWYVGRDNVVGGYQCAQHMDVAVWDRALTADDVKWAYNNTSLFIDEPWVQPSTFGQLLSPTFANAGVVGGAYIKTRHGGTDHGQSVVSSSLAYNFDAGDDVVIFTDAATATLPTPATKYKGRRYVVYNAASGTKTVTVVANDGSTINGATSVAVTGQYVSATFVCDGTNWYKL